MSVRLAGRKSAEKSNEKLVNPNHATPFLSWMTVRKRNNVKPYLLWQYFLVFGRFFNRQNHGSVDIDINISKWYVNFHELSINTRALNISKYVFVVSGKAQHARGSPSKPSNIQSMVVFLYKILLNHLWEHSYTYVLHMTSDFQVGRSRSDFTI